MTFACWIYLDVVTKDAEATFERYVELPFVPGVGMKLVFDEQLGSSIEIESVEYSIPDGVFWLTGSEDVGDCLCQCKPEDECCVLRVSDYVEDGWELRGEVKRGFDRTQQRGWMFDPDKTIWSLIE